MNEQQVLTRDTVACVALLSAITGKVAVVEQGKHKSWLPPLVTGGPPSKPLTGVRANCTASDIELESTAFPDANSYKLEMLILSLPEGQRFNPSQL